MSKTKISEFSTTPGNNTDINGINIAEGCAPSGINNAIRELMSDLKEWQSGAMDVYVIPQGTAAAPGIQLYGDLDTGLYGYAANQLGVAVGGASAGYFSSAGWVGNVNGTITGDINATTIDTTNLEVTNIKAKDGTAAITIANSTGRVTVSSELAVDNIAISGNAIGSSDTDGNVFIAPNGTGDIYLAADLNIIGNGGSDVILTTSAASDLVLNTNLSTNSGSIRIVDGSNGNISLTPNGTGGVYLENTNGTALFVRNSTAGTSGSSFTAYQNKDGAGNYRTVARSSGLTTDNGGNGSFVIETASSNTLYKGLLINSESDVFFYDSNGNQALKWDSTDKRLGINQTSPAATLDVVGQGVFSEKVTINDLEIGDSFFGVNIIKSTNTNGGVIVQTDGTGGVFLYTDLVTITPNGAGEAILSSDTGKDIILNTNGGTNSGSITIQDGVNGNILIAANGTGSVQSSSPTIVSVDSASDALRVTQIGAGNAILVEDSANPDSSPFVVTGAGAVGVGLTAPTRNIHISASTSPSGGLTGFQIDATGTGASATSALILNRTTTNAATSQIVGNIYFSHTLTDSTALTTAAQIYVVGNNNAGANTGNLYINPRTSTLFQVNGSTVATIDTNGIDTTNLEVTNIKAKDGTASITLADSTGVASFTANPILSGGTANGVLYLNASKEATSSSALTFNGSVLSVNASAPYFDLYATAQATNEKWWRLGSGSSNFAIVSINDAGTNADTPYSITKSGYLSTAHIWSVGGSEVARINSTGLTVEKATVINESGGDNDFRVEGDTDTHLIFADASTDRVGIGTNAPAAKLDVTGGSSTGGFIVNGSIASVRASSTVIDMGDSNRIMALGPNTTTAGTFKFIVASSNASVYTTAATIDSSGNLGLGVPPSAWSTSGKALEFAAGSIYSYSSGASGEFDYVYNAYFDGSWKYKASSSAASLYSIQPGVYKWFTAPSGTAGNAITFSQALTLDANRNLLLNGTSAGASAIGTFAIFNGTAPTGSVTDGVILYAQDVSSSSELKVRDEAGNVTTLSPHNFSLIPEGPSEDMAWAYYSEKGGKRINVDMLKLARMVEKLTGEKLVYES